MEPSDAQLHYSEELVCLPGIGICPLKPVIPRHLLCKTRPDYGLRNDATVYLCCQSLFKYLPDYDDVFPRIATSVPQAQFVFLAMNGVEALQTFLKRLDGSFSRFGLTASDHCMVLNALDTFDYWNLNLVSDVFLDSIGWSGCVSTLEALSCGLPVVTMPGQFMRGRHSYGILRQLGMTETIAADVAGYVDIAVRLGLDRDWREALIRRFGQNTSRLYSDTSSVRALEAFYFRAVNDRTATREKA